MTDEHRHPKIMCATASNQFYTLDKKSNYGGSINAILPGVNIASASNRSDTAEAFKSGTSMASPLLAAIMASLVGFEGLNRDAGLTVYTRVKANQIENLISGIPIPEAENDIAGEINAEFIFDEWDGFGNR